MSLIAGVLAFSEGSVVLATDAPDHFNGGTPVLNDGSLCINSEAIQQPNAVGGQYYDPEGRLGTDPLGAVASYAGGLPLTAQGNVAVGFDTPTNWNAGIPITASGRMAISPGWGLDATGEQIRAAIRDITKYGESLGPELVTNGTFTFDISGWTLNGGAHSWESGTLRRTPSGATGSYQDVPTVSGRTYEITGTRVLVSGAGTAGIYIYTGGGFSVNAGSATGAGTSSIRVIATSATIRVYLYTDGTRVADFDNVSVKEVITGFLLPGTAGARINASARSSVAMERQADGTYGYAPHNLLLYSAAVTGWSANASPTDGGDGPLVGGAATHKWTSTGFYSGYFRFLSSTPESGRPFCICAYIGLVSGASSVFIGTDSGGRALLEVNPSTGAILNGPAGSTVTAVSGGWLACAPYVGNGAAVAVVRSILSAGTTVAMAVWGNLGPTATAYVPTTSAAVYAPAVSHDGTDWGVQCEPAATNQIRNSAMVGAAAGSPGTLPTNWVVSLNGTLVTTVTTGVTMLGLPAIDLRIQGTASADFFVRPESLFNTVAASGQAWTSSHVLQLIDGTPANCTPSIMIAEYTDVGTFLAESKSTYTLDATIKRVSHTRTLNNASTQRVGGWIYFSAGNGAVIDMTIRIACPQLETNSVATSPILTYDSTVTRAADLLIVPNTVAGAIGNDMGTIAVDAVANVIGANGVVAANDASANNQVSLRSNNVAVVRLASSDVITPSIGTMVAGTRAKSAMSYQMRDAAASRANSTAVSAGDNLGLTQIQLGGLDGGTSANGSGLIYRIRTSKNLLSNNQDQILAALKSLTA